jgi:hypothetical protein
VYDGFLYVSYATNKDDAQYTRVPISNITLGIQPIELEGGQRLFCMEGRQLHLLVANATMEIFDLNGRCCLTASGDTDLSQLPAGLFIVKMRTTGTTLTTKILLR